MLKFLRKKLIFFSSIYFAMILILIGCGDKTQNENLAGFDNILSDDLQRMREFPCYSDQETKNDFLINAVTMANEEEVDKLLKCQADHNYLKQLQRIDWEDGRSASGQLTPLMALFIVPGSNWANRENDDKRVSIYRKLLKAGASLDIKDNDGETMLQKFFLCKQKSLLRELFRSFPDWLDNYPLKDSTAFKIKFWSNSALLELIFEKRDEDYIREIMEKENLLHLAVTVESLESTDKLLRLGANPNKNLFLSIYEDGTSLHIAAKSGNGPLVRLLLEYGSSPLIETHLRGKTPIDLAANEKIRRMLLDASRIP